MGNCLKPITTRVRDARNSVSMPKGMEISMNADGSGGAVPEVNPSPAKIKNAAYEKSNRKMRSDYTKETGKTLGKRHLSGTSPRRVSFACRFAGMKGAMKDDKGEPTRKAMALKKWGFSSVGASSSFCGKNKKS